MKRGFTLLELIVVIMILGILASFALPQFINAAEKARAGEALSLIPVLVASQIRYAVENGDYTTTLADLDVEVPASPKLFSITLVDATPGLTTNERVAYMTRNSTNLPGNRGAYIISGCENGRIYCTDATTGDCKAIGQGSTATACP